MPTRLSRYGQGHCREFAASGVQLNWRCTLERCRWQSPPDDRWHDYEQSSVIVEMSNVDRVVPPWPRPVPRVRPAPAAVSFRRPLAQPGASSRCPWKHVLSRNCGSVQLGDVQRHFFDTAGDAADGCEAPCGVVDNGACNTGSAAAVGARSSVTCSANLFRHQGRCR